MVFCVGSFLVIGGAIVYAAMTARDQKINNFQVGIGFGTTWVGRTEDPETIVPGREYDFRLTPKVEGTDGQFIRILIQPEIMKIQEGVKQLFPSEIGKELILNGLNTEKWKYGEDGFYYFLGVHKKGNVAPVLFQGYTINSEVPDDYIGAKMSFLVKTEGIQVADHAYRKAWWNGSAPTSGPLQEIDQVLSQFTE